MFIAATVFAAVAVMAVLYVMTIVFDKSGVTPYEMNLVKTAVVVALVATVVAMALWAYRWSQFRDQPKPVQPQLVHDTLWLHDTTVKFVRAKADGASRAAVAGARQAEARSPVFLEKFDAR